MYGIDNRDAVRGRSVPVRRPRRRLQPACERLELRALMAGPAGTNVPAWTGEWTMNGGAGQTNGVTIDINFNDFYPHFLEFISIQFNASYTSLLGLQGGAVTIGSPTYSAFPLITKTSNDTYGFDGELVGTIIALPEAGSTTPSTLLGTFDFNLDQPTSADDLPTDFTGNLYFTGAGGSANTTVPLDMTWRNFGSTEGITNPNANAGFDNPWDLPRVAPDIYNIEPTPELIFTSVTVTAGQAKDIDVLNGVTDPQGTTLSVKSVGSYLGEANNISQDGGVVTISSDFPGIVTYDPPANSGDTTDGFVFIVVNELGKAAVGKVTITITPANNQGSGGQGSGGPGSGGQGPSGDNLPPGDSLADDLRAEGALALVRKISELDDDVRAVELRIRESGASLADKEELKKLLPQEKNLVKQANKLLDKGQPADPAIQYVKGLLLITKTKFTKDYRIAEISVDQ